MKKAHTEVKISPEDIEGAEREYERVAAEANSVYRLVGYSLKTQWGKIPEMVDALTVLLITWNGRFYNPGLFSQQALNEWLSDHLKILSELRERDIATPVSYTHLDVYKRQQRGIGIERNRPITAFTLHRGCERMRKRDQTRLGVTGFDELRRLRYVFSYDKPAGNLIVNCEVSQRGLRSAAVRSGRRIRNRNLLDRRIEQSLNPQLRQIQWRVVRHPQHQPADRIAVKRIFRCKSLGD